MEIETTVDMAIPADAPTTEGASPIDDLGEIPDYWVEHIKEAALNADSGSLLTLRSHIIAAMAEVQREREARADLQDILQEHFKELGITTTITFPVLNVGRVLDAYRRINMERGSVEQIVIQAENELHSGYAGSLPNRVQAVYNRLERKVWKAEADFKHLRDDTQVWLRAVGIIATSIGNAGTHAEKNARLRGLIEMIESAIGSVRESRDRDNEWGVRMPDIFRSDYPVREYVQRIHQLEHEIKLMNGKDDNGSAPGQVDNISF